MNTRDKYLEVSKGHATEPFTPRIHLLQKMNGKRFSTGNSVDFGYLDKHLGYGDLEHLKWIFKINKLDMAECIKLGKVGEKSLGKWLTHAHIPEDIASKVCAARVPGIELTLTTRYKDFVLMGSNSHYDTCITGKRPHTFAYYLHKPNVFLLIDRSPSGMIKSRSVGRVVRVTRANDSIALGVAKGTVVILFNRPYGIQVTLPDMLEGIPCFQQAGPDYCGGDRVEISLDLIRYEVGTERIGEDPNDDDKIWDDLSERQNILKPKGHNIMKFNTG